MDHLELGIKQSYSVEELEYLKKASPFTQQFLQQTNEVARYLSEELSQVWHEFVCRMRSVPIITQLESGALTTEGYRQILLDLRQQVVEGSAWIMRGASSLPASLAALRREILKHALEESTDYRMLETDYVNLGGRLPEIQNAPKNIGSQALSDFIFWNASKEKPYHLTGAIFIIEGQPARPGYWNRWHLWAEQLQRQGLHSSQCTFFRSHAEKDLIHTQWLESLFQLPIATMELARQVVRTARVVGRLYVLQFESIGQY